MYWGYGRYCTVPRKIHEVILSPVEERFLTSITHAGRDFTAREILHAQVLLHSNDAHPDTKQSNKEIAEWLGISATTVNAIRRAYADGGLDAALYRKTRVTPPVAAKITGDVEARIIATALGPAPEGYARWTLRLLAEYCQEHEYVVEISHTRIGELLNTNELKPHLSEYWCIPKQNDPFFVANMEDVLTIYQLPYDPDVPVLCMDEMPTQLLGEVRARINAKPIHLDPETELPQHGYCEKIDYEYKRCGTASIFMFTEPLGGWRHAIASPRRTRVDWAQMMREIADVYYPDCKRIILVSDNLNTHTKAAFYEAYPPKTAFRLAQRFEMHHTPKHGSWLNMAETELSALSMQCVGKTRVDNLEELNEMIRGWEADRNHRQIGVNWQFTTADARIKLRRLYPKPVFES